MSTDYLNKNGLSYFWSKLKAYFAPKAHTHNAFEMKHSYTTAANAAKNWYRIANASTQQLDTSKPIRAQFIVTAYNTSYAADYYETWFVNAIVFGRQAHIIIFGGSGVPFSQARILYENTVADIDSNDRPAIDLYLNYVLPNGTTKIEIEEIYNNGGWTFVADGQLAASTVPSGFENIASAPRNTGVHNSTYADYVSYLNRQVSNFTAAFTLADSYLYRSRTLNCTGTFTITIPSINSGYMWCVIKNKNTSSGVITLHPSTTSVLIDGSNADIKLQPMEYVCIHSAGTNNYSLIADGRWKSQKADKATTLAGYGITDAKIANGTITLGSNSITPLISVPSHNQASNTITAMTGYSKPASSSAIATSDTLNQAIGKLEKAIDDADISNTVHLTGNEFVGGIKEFGNSYYDSTREGETDWESSSLIIRYQNYIKGSGAPSADKHANLLFLDKTGTNVDWNGRLGIIESSVYSDGATSTKIGCYKNEVVDGVDTRDNAVLYVGYDTNGIKFAQCPSTSENRNNPTDIVTRDWIPKDSRIVHTTGDETVGGIKTYTDTQLWNARVARRGASVAYGYNGEDSSITKGTAPSDNSTHHFAVDFYGTYARDYKDRIAMFQCRYFADKTSTAGIYAYKCDTAQNATAEHISIYYPPSGDPYTYAPTPAASSNSTSIATTAWVRTFCDTTQKYMKSVSVTGSGNAVTAASLSNGTLTLTKGTSYVTIDSTQTITGSKTFSTSGSLLMPFRSTAVQRNTNVSSNATCGFSFAEKNNVNISLVEGFVYPSKNTGLSFLTRKWASTSSTFRGVQLIWQNNDDIFLRPADADLDNIYLGGSSYRWKAVYSANGSIQTSDERMKSEIGFIPDAVLDAWADVDFCQFKFNAAVGREGREAARFHTGVVAQKVQKAFSGAGLDASRYGLFCYDRWDAEPEQLREDGTVLQSAREAGDMYSMRYEEALCMEAAYMRRENARLKKRVANLEDRLAALELRLGSE